MSELTVTRDQLLELDLADPLNHYRQQFDLRADTVYLDGNSLGPPLIGLHQHLQHFIENQWRQDLISAWNKHHWFAMGQKLGEKLSLLIGAKPNEVIVTDNTSINLFKLLVAAVKHQAPRKKIIAVNNNFPTDLYMAQSVAALLGDLQCQLLQVDPKELIAAIDNGTAVIVLSQVDFRTGNLLDVASIMAAAAKHGALVIWDISHTVGALPFDVKKLHIELAVGCTYKFLNGGPGSPAFVFVAEHLQQQMQQPLTGWFGHNQPFAFSKNYQPAQNIHRFQSGTPSVVALSALDHALSLWQQIDLQQIQQKSTALTHYFIQLVKQECGDCNIGLATSEHNNQRGSQVSLTHPDGYAIVQALIANNVIGDFRSPNIMRFGFAPLYVTYIDVWNSVQTLKQVMVEEQYKDPDYQNRQTVT